MLSIQEILLSALEQKASDIHLTVGVPPIFRINGQLIRFKEELIEPVHTVQFGNDLTSDEEWERFQKDGELDFSTNLYNMSRFRINVYRERGNIALAIRLIPTVIPALEELNLPVIIQLLVQKPQGLILVTGPTGSGKSTTLAAMIDFVNRQQSKHIITLEDPIEYLHQHGKSIIDQREIGRDTKTFASGLRASLRQDPDIILVGELRDLETIQTAITAAETGHLVLSTLHSRNASNTINRIIDVFPEQKQTQIRVQLADALVGVISQRLVPNGNKTSRTAATEILINNSAVANLIRTEKVHQIDNVLQTSKSLGMHTFEMNMRELIKAGAVSKEQSQLVLAGGL
ncbi:type IV pilus twitching motility protein PilT [Bacillus sp. AFS017336]|uniref:type IV pilus twitching motility protein PilT n=1 Tax=Bacillus sp. AFS017336 TaxID=2033489 RepID=UPI000BF1C748|nr:type IV pilus twitching motility protein PilT [Bacillus sp. AFS017336]PEL13439.1 type IV pili twitching motility protein PilT [Bacillus sp. AFS017336]